MLCFRGGVGLSRENSDGNDEREQCEVELESSASISQSVSQSVVFFYANGTTD